jgi:itaconyl-CoA hydratase
MSDHPAYAERADGRLTETLGLEFDAMAPGMRIAHRPGFLLSWAEARQRALIAGDHAPIVIDPEAARAAGGGRLIISEPWLVTLTVAATTRAFGRVVANLAWEDVSFPDPGFDGDWAFSQSEILETRASRSRPDQGIVTIRTTAKVRGEDRTLCDYRRTLLVYRGRSAAHQAGGYA